MNKLKLFSFFAVILIIILTTSIFTFAQGVIFEFGSPEKVRAELLKAMESKDFAKGDDKVRAQSFIQNMDFKELSEENQEFVDKYLKQVMGQKDFENNDKEIANKYFGGLSDGKFSIETGSELKYNGEKLITKSGASIDPEKIPGGVKSVKEKDGKFVFEYKASVDEKPKQGEKKEEQTAKVSLEKGSFDKDMNPSNDAVFSVEGNDVYLGGVEYHPDGGKVERLGKSGYKITDNNFKDNDYAGIIVPGDKFGLNNDLHFSATQGESYVGVDKAQYEKTKNGLLVNGKEFYAKGDFELELSEPEKDQPFAEYKFKNGLLDESGRKVIDQQTNSEIGIHYQKDGKEVVWDVDGDDFENAPEGTPNAGKKQEVKKFNVGVGNIFNPDPKPGVPPRETDIKNAEKADESDEETDGTTEEEKPETKSTDKKPVEKQKPAEKESAEDKKGTEEQPETEPKIKPTEKLTEPKPEEKPTPKPEPVVEQNKELVQQSKTGYSDQGLLHGISTAIDGNYVKKENINPTFTAEINKRSLTSYDLRPASVALKASAWYKSLTGDDLKLATELKNNYRDSAMNWAQNVEGLGLVDMGQMKTVSGRVIGDWVFFDISPQGNPAGSKSYYRFPKKYFGIYNKFMIAMNK